MNAQAVSWQPHPQVAALADELAGLFPVMAAPPVNDLQGVASLAIVLDMLSSEIRETGCDLSRARTFAQIYCRLHDRLAELDCPSTGTVACIIARATVTTDATLMLMPAIGNA